MATFPGTAGPDDFTGTSGSDVFTMGDGGTDTVNGAEGNDTFIFDNALTVTDRVNGGDGYDILTLSGNYPMLQFGETTLLNVEEIELAAGGIYTLVMDNNVVAAGESLTIDASLLTADGALFFNGSAETDGSFFIIGGSGGDIILGDGAGSDYVQTGGGNDAIAMSRGGFDFIEAGAGNDTIEFFGHFSTGDAVDGGDGANDTLRLEGDYSAGVLFGAATLLNVERIVFLDGFDYDLTLASTTITVGTTMSVDASDLESDDSIVFAASASTAATSNINYLGGMGQDVVYETGGNDTIRGGWGNDTIVISVFGGDTDQAFGDDGDDVIAIDTGSDFADGGAGNDTLILPGGNSNFSTFALTAANIIGFEALEGVGTSGVNTVSLEDNVVAADVTFTADFSALSDQQTVAFDGSAESNASFLYRGSAGNDDVRVGAGNDAISGRGGDDVLYSSAGSDEFDGGADADTFNASADGIGVFAHLVWQWARDGWGDEDRLFNVENVAGSAFNDVIIGGARDNELTGASGDDWVEDIGDGNDVIAGGAGNDVLWGGDGEDALTGDDGNDGLLGGAGDDNLEGGDGIDWVYAGLGGDDILGGEGNDVLFGGEGGGVNAASDGADTIDGGAGVDAIFGEGGHDFLTGGDGDDWAYGGAGDDTIEGGAGNDVLAGEDDGDQITGGDGNDFVFGALGDDIVNGGDGNDWVEGSFGSDIITGGAGADSLFGGSNDRFVYLALSDSTEAVTDVIGIFSRPDGDKIDVSAIDADGNAGNGDSAFTFGVDFTGIAGQAAILWEAANNRSLVRFDVDGDTVSDMTIVVLGVELEAGDFIA